jgi:hypothetical protein
MLNLGLITPDYYANLMDYCYNRIKDENGVLTPKNTLGEFNHRGKLIIDDPATIDFRRERLGFLPINKIIHDPNKLPQNYRDWYDSK